MSGVLPLMWTAGVLFVTSYLRWVGDGSVLQWLTDVLSHFLSVNRCCHLACDLARGWKSTTLMRPWELTGSMPIFIKSNAALLFPVSSAVVCQIINLQEDGIVTQYAQWVIIGQLTDNKQLAAHCFIATNNSLGLLVGLAYLPYIK